MYLYKYEYNILKNDFVAPVCVRFSTDYDEILQTRREVEVKGRRH